MKLPLQQVAALISAGGSFAPEVLAEGYSIDSRTLAAGELFFAIQGERRDGHAFVPQAFEKGAAGAVVARSRNLAAQFPRHNLLQVEDTLAALQALGAAVRRRWAKPLVAVTGSAGKTSTKEAIAQVLSSRFRTFKSEGNLNNHFGLPLELLRLGREHEIAVVEMGMSHAGEIAALAALAAPQVGVVTLVAPVHLEFFNSVEEIARAKHELVASLPPDGTAVLNADDPYVSQFGRGFRGKVITFGIERPAEVRAVKLRSRGAAGSSFEIHAGGQRVAARLPLLGTHSVYNALAAVAVGLDRGIPLARAAQALAKLQPCEQRGQMLSVGGVKVINDCYNSNPKALQAMVDALAALAARRRIVVAGEMLELGAQGEELHRACGRYLAQKKIDVLVGVRGLAQGMVEAASAAGVAAEFAATPEAAGEWLARNTRRGDLVLLKASRGVKLERALETWQAAARAAKKR